MTSRSTWTPPGSQDCTRTAGPGPKPPGATFKVLVCSAVVVLLELDHPGAALSDLTVAHDEHFGHGHAHLPARGALHRAGELRHDDVALLDHAHDLQFGRVDEVGRTVDGLVVCLFAGQVEGT